MAAWCLPGLKCCAAMLDTISLCALSAAKAALERQMSVCLSVCLLPLLLELIKQVNKHHTS